MELSISYVLGYIILPLIASFGSYLFKGLFDRLKSLEVKMQDTVSEPKTRQLINDRYDPLAQDIRDIKEKLDKLFDLYIHNPKRSP